MTLIFLQQKKGVLKMERNNLEELLHVLESIRSERYPDIPMEVVRDIVFMQYENQSEQDRVQGRQKTTKIVMAFLDDVVTGKER